MKVSVFQCLCTLCGYATTSRWRASSKKVYDSPKLLQPILHSKGVWVVSILKRNTVQIMRNHKKIYKKKIVMWCPTVPNTFFVARRLGKVYITGNTPVQSAAGDICFYGLIRFQEWLDTNSKKTKIVGTVHDSILTEVPLDEVTEVCSILPKLMTENIPKVTVPLKADIDVLDRWKK